MTDNKTADDLNEKAAASLRHSDDYGYASPVRLVKVAEAIAYGVLALNSSLTLFLAANEKPVPAPEVTVTVKSSTDEPEGAREGLAELPVATEPPKPKATRAPRKAVAK